MDRSLFSRASPRSRALSPSTPLHELPRWRSPSPMTASIIPPPIVQSTYAIPTRAPAQSVLLERPTPAMDRQAELEADLQFLLDAQADGLAGGYEGGDRASTGSTTPTVTSARSPLPSSRTVRSTRRRPGLRSARRGIHSRMLALSAVKAEELLDLDDVVREKERTLQQIDAWEKKREGLKDASETVAANEDAVRVQRLREDATTLQGEINSVELQLSDMKLRHRKLLRQISAVENAVDAKVASYANSLRQLDEEIQQFLSSNPIQDSAQNSPENGTASVWQLPLKRRTLDMARVYWTDERDAVLLHRKSIEHEQSALDEGANIWKEVCSRVNDFEQRLRSEMSKLSEHSHAETSAWEEPSAPSANRLSDLKDTIDHLDPVIDFLETRFEVAQDRHWNLLIAAIGAEVEAMNKGRDMLREMLGDAENQRENLVDTQSENTAVDPDDETHDLNAKDEGDEINTPNTSFAIEQQPPGGKGIADTEDDPDPELLFSNHESDTE